MSEFEEMKEDLQNAKLGSYLIVPLKYEEGEVDYQWLGKIGTRRLLTTMDINESIKNTINSENTANVLFRYEITADVLIREFFSTEADSVQSLLVCDKKTPISDISPEEDYFKIHSAYIYIFHTQVAFLCLGITYPRMDTLECICHLGFADSKAAYFYLDRKGEMIRFSLDEKLSELCEKTGLKCFYQSGTSLFLEGYTYTVAVVPKRFRYLETIRQITFNLHLMCPLDYPAEDASEEDIRYVYAVKTQELGSYRWGCCVTSQTISYVVADENMDLDAEMDTQAEDGLPVILLGLYQKYTCLRFAEMLSILDKKKMKRLSSLRKKMLEFKAYGVIAPAHISRWHNVKQIYQHIIETNGISTAVEDISDKINILAEHQKELESAINEAVMGIITVFGIVSILVSVLSIIQILSGGTPLEWVVMLISFLAIMVIVLMVMVRQRKER